MIRHQHAIVADIPIDAKGFKDFQNRWCERLSEVPHIDDPGLHPLSPEQQAVADNQAAPENQWALHPAVDGCEPDEPPPPIIR